MMGFWWSATQPFLVSSRNAPPLRDDTKNGCVADQGFGDPCRNSYSDYMI